MAGVFIQFHTIFEGNEYLVLLQQFISNRTGEDGLQRRAVGDIQHFNGWWEFW